jgi:aspartate aminotransferase
VKLAGGTNKILRGGEQRLQDHAAGTGEGDRPRTKVLVLNSPSNPAGHAYTPEELKGLADVVARHPNVIVFSDEIYEKLVYDGLKFVSFATLHPDLLERTLTFNCHSKSFAMTGWRVGYIGGPKAAIDAINKLQSQMTSHITSFVQIRRCAALTDPRGAQTVEQMRQEFEKRGRHMWERLSALPKVKCVKPQGAFYCFPNVSAYFGKEGRRRGDHRCRQLLRRLAGTGPRRRRPRQRQRLRHPRAPELRDGHAADRQGTRPDRRVPPQDWTEGFNHEVTKDTKRALGLPRGARESPL